MEFLGGFGTGPSWERDDQHVEMFLKKLGLAGGKLLGRPRVLRNGINETDTLEGAAMMLEAASTHSMRHVHCSCICCWIVLSWPLTATEREGR